MLTQLMERGQVKTGLLLFVAILLGLGCCLTALADEASAKQEVVLLNVDNMT